VRDGHSPVGKLELKPFLLFEVGDIDWHDEFGAVIADVADRFRHDVGLPSASQGCGQGFAALIIFGPPVRPRDQPVTSSCTELGRDVICARADECSRHASEHAELRMFSGWIDMRPMASSSAKMLLRERNEALTSACGIAEYARSSSANKTANMRTAASI
jgi:hypothetical protein